MIVYAMRREQEIENKLVDAVDKDDALFLIDFDKSDLDDFRVAGLHRATDILCLDRHLAVAAVNQHTQRNTLGAPEVEQAVHGGANGAAGIENVVDQDEVHVVHAKINIGGLQ